MGGNLPAGRALTRGARSDEDRPMPTITASPPFLDRSFLDDFAHRWLDAWNRNDAEGVAALCTPDIEFTDPAIGTVRGRRAVADWVRMCQRAFPDYRFEEPEPPLLATDRPKVIAPWRMLGTHTGRIEPPGFAPTGRRFVVDGVDHWWFEDGLVGRYRSDYDLAGLMRQLGLLPQRGSRGERATAALQRLGERLRRTRVRRRT
jgi:steroid delta-isomerase-like uncharacterized protein